MASCGGGVGGSGVASCGGGVGGSGVASCGGGVGVAAGGGGVDPVAHEPFGGYSEQSDSQ